MPACLATIFPMIACHCASVDAQNLGLGAVNCNRYACSAAPSESIQPFLNQKTWNNMSLSGSLPSDSSICQCGLWMMRWCNGPCISSSTKHAHLWFRFWGVGYPAAFFHARWVKPYWGRPKQISRHVLRQSQCMPWSTVPFVWLVFGPERAEIWMGKNTPALHPRDSCDFF